MTLMNSNLGVKIFDVPLKISHVPQVGNRWFRWGYFADRFSSAWSYWFLSEKLLYWKPKLWRRKSSETILTSTFFVLFSCCCSRVNFTNLWAQSANSLGSLSCSFQCHQKNYTEPKFTWCQFHQCFTCAFFVQKSLCSFFSTYM